MRSFLLTAFLVLTSTFFSPVMAQSTNDRSLADQYFANGEYDKAAVLYDKLYDRDPYGTYPNYLKCLTSQREFSKAERLIKKYIKLNENNLSPYVDMGQLYALQQDGVKAKQQYDKAIKLLKPDQQMIVTLANAFMQVQETDYALQTYLEGKRLLKGSYSFRFETADVYFQKGDFAKMIDEYLGAVEENPGYRQSVQNILQSRLGSDPDGSKNDLLRVALLRKVQRNADQIDFAEMLIWLFIQQKDFESAFIQSKALDKRLSEDGNRVFSLTMLSASNQNYDAAIKCYQYIIEKGKGNPYYLNARMELLNTQNKKITENGNYSQVDLLKLETDYYSTLNELGRSANTASLIRGLSHLQVFYLDKIDEAIENLEMAITYPGIRPITQAECKLELGDIYLFSGNVWDSDLLYAQVDKSFKNDPMGQEAKYRSARLDYFRGDFLWAQAQLDILKSATSQLIANDALSLSLLISDNIDADSSTDALFEFSRADLLMYRKQDSLAMLVLDSLLLVYPDHSLTDDVYYKQARIMDARKNYLEEDSLLAKIIREYPDDILADDALFIRANLYENKLNNKEKAMEYFQELLLKYPGSLYVVEARKRFRSLRGDVLN